MTKLDKKENPSSQNDCHNNVLQPLMIKHKELMCNEFKGEQHILQFLSFKAATLKTGLI